MIFAVIIFVVASLLLASLFVINHISQTKDETIIPVGFFEKSDKFVLKGIKMIRVFSQKIYITIKFFRYRLSIWLGSVRVRLYKKSLKLARIIKGR